VKICVHLWSWLIFGVFNMPWHVLHNSPQFIRGRDEGELQRDSLKTYCWEQWPLLERLGM
jgi:hypothetical protein